MKTYLTIICLIAGLVGMTSSFAKAPSKKQKCKEGNTVVKMVRGDLTDEDFQVLSQNHFTVAYEVNSKGKPYKIKAKKSETPEELQEKLLNVFKDWRFKKMRKGRKAYRQKGCKVIFG